MSYTAKAHVILANPRRWIAEIHDRLRSFGANTLQDGDDYSFEYDFGTANIVLDKEAYSLLASADSSNGLSRIKELLATAVELHARPDKPVIRWEGDAAEQRQLPQLRVMTVATNQILTPGVRRITLSGYDLARFHEFSGIHAKLLFPRPGTLWPTMGENGLPVWPEVDKRPDVRVYTVRRVDAEAGTLEFDIVQHSGQGVGALWASQAKVGDVVGVLGPVGRPIRLTKRLMMGGDETALPALSRIIEALPEDAEGTAIIEVADENERVAIQAPPHFNVQWLYREDGASTLVDAVLSHKWAHHPDSFGWFASEHGRAARIRHEWREVMGLSRDRTLVAGYWKRGEKGAMARI